MFWFNDYFFIFNFFELTILDDLSSPTNFEIDYIFPYLILNIVYKIIFTCIEYIEIVKINESDINLSYLFPLIIMLLVLPFILKSLLYHPFESY